MKALIFMTVIVLVSLTFATTPMITRVTAQQRYPWNGKVDISYTINGDVPSSGRLKVMAIDQMTGINYIASEVALSGDKSMNAATHRLVWDMSADGLTFKSTNVVFKVSCEMPSSTRPLYCVIDLSAGANASSYPVIYSDAPPSGGFNVNEYKTTKLVLRRIEPGAVMTDYGSCITVTKPYYIGIFELTQKQYKLVMGGNPSELKGDMRPVEQVSWDMIRGNSAIYNWPIVTNVHSTSFVGKLRERTGIAFELPTEEQWEYACRAGTTSEFNNGGDMEDEIDQLGRETNNRFDGRGGYSEHTTVGSYQPNAWGLYDMHGNIMEWCLDYYDKDLSNGVIVSVGSSTDRVLRGGCWCTTAMGCTSAARLFGYPSYYKYCDMGFRLVGTLSE